MSRSPNHRIAGSDLWHWRQRAIAAARQQGIDPAEVDWLLRGLCQVDGLALRLGTLAARSQVPAQVDLADLVRLWQQRITERVPVQHLVGETTWRQFTLAVSPEVLIPRPETELLIDLAVDLIDRSPQADALRQGIWVDLGTGSGAIAIGLAAALPQASILAVDISAAALAIAQGNAARNGVGDRIQWLQGSWFEPLAPWQGHIAGMVANPPYIPSAIVPTLDPEVAEHEPHLALDGGADGLVCVRQLMQQAPVYLQPGAGWLVEVMIDQPPLVAALLAAQATYRDIRQHPDLTGVGRFVTAFCH